MTLLDERVRIVRGDITEQAVDAIVNAANQALAPGGGVCGAIHARAGRRLAEECAGLGGCPTGEARLTGGWLLPARHVIQAVGPVWQGGGQGEDELLRSAYQRSLELCERHRLASVAFPAISTGIFGYPLERATRIALGCARGWLAAHPLPAQVVFCCFSEGDERTYRRLAAEILG